MANKITHADITIERAPSGWIIASAMVDGYLVRREYSGYTIREARRMFHRSVNEREGGH